MKYKVRGNWKHDILVSIAKITDGVYHIMIDLNNKRKTEILGVGGGGGESSLSFEDVDNDDQMVEVTFDVDGNINGEMSKGNTFHGVLIRDDVYNDILSNHSATLFEPKKEGWNKTVEA